MRTNETQRSSSKPKPPSSTWPSAFASNASLAFPATPADELQFPVYNIPVDNVPVYNASVYNVVVKANKTGQRAPAPKQATAAPPIKRVSPEQQLKRFMAKYTPEIAALAEEILAAMRKRLPGAVQLVYDNYNALVVGFGPNERASDAIFSIALYPRWVTLFFLRGANLPDPQRLLKGSGKIVRQLVLQSAKELENPAVRQLMAEALERSAVSLDPTVESRLVIKSISLKQRPRRPR